MSAELVLTALAGILYALAAIFGLVYLLGARSPAGDRAIPIAAAGAGLCLASALVLRGVTAARIPAFGAFEAVACYAVALTIVYGYLITRYGVLGLSALVLPFLTVIVVGSLPVVSAAVPAAPDQQGVWLALHVASAFIGYGLFTMVSVLAVAYLIQDRYLKRKHLGQVFRRLPSLETLDQLMQVLIGSAFLLFSCAIVFGIVLTHVNHWSPKWITDPKIACSAAVWLVYATLFHLRLGGDHHGRRLAVVAVVGLICLLFAFIGVHMVAQSMHSFAFVPPGAR